MAITIYVDADACPVKEEILKVAYRHNIETFIVSNAWLRMDVGPLVKKIVVSEGADEADNWIADHIGEGDIAITADIPLASRCLEKSAFVLGPTGKEFTDDNIGIALVVRDIRSEQREMGEGKKGQMRGHYNAAFSNSDRSNFLQQLERLIQKLK
jgi:uncharacterized protein YaiI (UPF0178 family)